MLCLNRLAFAAVLSAVLGMLSVQTAHADRSVRGSITIYGPGVTFFATNRGHPRHLHPVPPVGLRRGHCAIYPRSRHCVVRRSRLPHRCRVFVPGIGPAYSARCLRARGY